MDPFAHPRRSAKEDLNIMLDVPMVIDAEMRRSNKSGTVSWRVGEGSVVDFEREAGEPVDPRPLVRRRVCDRYRMHLSGDSVLPLFFRPK